MTSSAETVLVPPRSRRRGRIWVWMGVAAAVLLITAAVGITIVLNRYEPLENGSVFRVDGAGFQTVETFSDQDAAIFDYRDGDVATVQFALRNAGSWEVRIRRLLHPSELDAETMQTPMQPIRMLAGPLTTESNTITPPIEHFHPFRPFALAPGEERHVAIQFRFEDCAGMRDGDVFVNNSYTVRYSTLWVSREMEVAFPLRLVVKGPIEACPRL